jgi:hypothetical protein
MKQFLLNLVKDKVALLAAVLFLVGLGFLVVVGASDIRSLSGALVAGYFMVWGMVALLWSGPQEELRKQFLVTTVTVGCCLVVAEVPVLAGKVDYRQVFSLPVGYEWEQPGRIFDKQLLWLTKPHYETHVKYTRGNIGIHLCLPPGAPLEYDLRYDQNGFRNNEELTTADIAVIGDSYIESPMMPSDVLMTSVLQQLRAVKIANLGIAGYGPQQELTALERYALHLQPKTIVGVFYEGNDLEDVHYYEQMQASLSNGSNKVHSRWVRSFTRNALSAMLRAGQGCIPHPFYLKRFGTLRENDGTERRIFFLNNSSTLSVRELEALEKTRRAIAEANRLCEESGIQFAVVYVPGSYRVHHGLPNLIQVSDEVRWWKTNDLPERFRSMIQEISPQIDYLDLTPFFRMQAQQGTEIFLPDDTHWTAAGHRIAAEALSQFFSAHPPRSRQLAIKG